MSDTYAAKLTRARDARLIAWRALIAANESGIGVPEARAAYDYADKVSRSVRDGRS